jgi:hypothetical protein
VVQDDSRSRPVLPLTGVSVRGGGQDEEVPRNGTRSRSTYSGRWLSTHRRKCATAKATGFGATHAPRRRLSFWSVCHPCTGRSAFLNVRRFPASERAASQMWSGCRSVLFLAPRACDHLPPTSASATRQSGPSSGVTASTDDTPMEDGAGPLRTDLSRSGGGRGPRGRFHRRGTAFIDRHHTYRQYTHPS